MKIFLCLIGFIISFSLTGQTSAEKNISKQQLKDDLQFLTRTIENVHPNPYHTISKEKFVALSDSITNSFQDSMTAAEAWPLFARLMASLDEGHSTMSYPKEKLKQIQDGEEKIFPLLISEFDGEHLIVRYDLSNEMLLHPGDRITKINDRPVTELMKYLMSFYGGLPNWRTIQVIRDIGGNFVLHKINPPYKIEIINGSVKKEITIQGTTFPELLQKVAEIRKANSAATTTENFTFQRIDGNTGYLNFRSMRNLPEFEKFLDSVFTSIKESPVEGLIIDLRRNGGGNSVLGERLLNYITSKPFRMGGGSLWKVSDEYKEFIRRQSSSNSVYKTGSFQSYLSRKTGDIIKGIGGKPNPPGKNPLRFEGKVCVLIGPNTFSSANMLTNAIKDYQLATLIGEPSGEPGNDYGEMYVNDLPNTGLTFSTCVKQFIRANGDASDTDPIFPDIVVKQKSNDQKDDVLEFAKEWIRKK